MQEISVKQNNEDLKIKIYLCIVFGYSGTHESTIRSAVPHVKKSFRGDLTPEKKWTVKQVYNRALFPKKFIISMRNVGYMKSSLEHDWKLKAAAEQSLVEGKDLTGTHTRPKIYGDPRRWRSQFVRRIKEQNVPYVQTCVERMVCLRCRSICFLLRGKRDFPRNNFSQFLTGNNQISISKLSFHNPPSEWYLQSATKLLRHCTQIG